LAKKVVEKPLLAIWQNILSILSDCRLEDCRLTKCCFEFNYQVGNNFSLLCGRVLGSDFQIGLPVVSPRGIVDADHLVNVAAAFAGSFDRSLPLRRLLLEVAPLLDAV
jgi:hypothetical protein